MTKLPGFGLPVNYRPEHYFPTAVLDWSGTILTVRELNMMAIMDKITDKPDWDKKVFDNTIILKWRQEALGTEGMDVSEKMFDWVGTVLLSNKVAVLPRYLSWHLLLGKNLRALLQDQRFVRSAFWMNARDILGEIGEHLHFKSFSFNALTGFDSALPSCGTKPNLFGAMA